MTIVLVVSFLEKVRKNPNKKKKNFFLNNNVFFF